MTWEEKFEALQALHDDSMAVNLRMRTPGDWYVHSGIEIGGDGFLRGATQSGATPEAAVNEAWKQYTELPLGEWLTVGGQDKDRHCYLWNGYRWAEVRR